MSLGRCAVWSLGRYAVTAVRSFERTARRLFVRIEAGTVWMVKLVEGEQVAVPLSLKGANGRSDLTA